jgi:hypothetical protein
MEGCCILYADYFADNPLHGEAVFRRRFRMSRKLFLKIVYALRDYDSYFSKLDCTGMAGFFALQKCMVAMRMQTGTEERERMKKKMREKNEEESDTDTGIQLGGRR